MSTPIWKKNLSCEELNRTQAGTLGGHIGIEFIEIGDDHIRARMPVDERTFQPMGILHGGASVVLAETIGSVASFLCIEGTAKAAVGLEVNANHLRPATGGWVYGRCTPIHVGRTTHVWQIELSDEQGRRTCVSRLTMAVIDRPPQWRRPPD
ncbi:MAG: hotdog fold thioesterase [Limnobacter sp.]|nr:hotdog fold thioesterase [Limnobacter sp.]